MMYGGCKNLLIDKANKILFIKFNNIAKKNSFDTQTYIDLGRILRIASQDDSITMIIFMGVGNFFSSGNDLSVKFDNENLEKYLQKADNVLKEMLSAIIDCPKVLVALVNGPAIGIGATLAGLCDMIWCEENAYFLTPFTKLGLVPEGCSSYLMPLIIGRSKATELLLFSEKMTSKNALQCNFVSRIYKKNDLDTIVLPKLKEYSELPASSLQITKKLIRMQEKDALYRALNTECEELLKRFQSEEFITALLDFAKKKSKL